MRISDWSSDVCSSDLVIVQGDASGVLRAQVALDRRQHIRGETLALDDHPHLAVEAPGTRIEVHRADDDAPAVDRDRLGVQAHEGRLHRQRRAGERRVGTAWVRTGRTRWGAYH